MQFKTVSFPDETTTYVMPTWDEMNQLAFEISKGILGSGKQIDRIVTLAKGGWPMTRSIVDFLQVNKVASIGVKFYKDINKKLDKPEVYQDIPVSVAGERVLLFDDVADTGTSLEFVKQYLMDAGVKEVTTATLFYKPHSTITPDFYGAETNDWVIFPYDVIEAYDILGKQWSKEGLDSTEIQSRLLQLGAKQEWLELYP